MKIPAFVILLSSAAALWWILKQLRHIRQWRELANLHIRPDTAFEQRYWQLFTHATDPVFTLDLQLAFIRANRAAEAVFGAKSSELQPKNLKDAIGSENTELDDLIGRLIGGEPSVLQRVTIRRPNGGQGVTLDMNCRLLFKDGAPSEIEVIACGLKTKFRPEPELELATANN